MGRHDLSFYLCFVNSECALGTELQKLPGIHEYILNKIKTSIGSRILRYTASRGAMATSETMQREENMIDLYFGKHRNSVYKGFYKRNLD